MSELQAEATRLITALDEQKAAADAERIEAAKKDEELSKERTARMEEVEELRQKMKQFADYDELKRELEIMKVGARTLLL